MRKSTGEALEIEEKLFSLIFPGPGKSLDAVSFLPELQGRELRFIDMDTFQTLNAVKNKDGFFTFRLPTASASGRLVMVKEVQK